MAHSKPISDVDYKMAHSKSIQLRGWHRWHTISPFTVNYSTWRKWMAHSKPISDVDYKMAHSKSIQLRTASMAYNKNI
jgi:hypothetical protein